MLHELLVVFGHTTVSSCWFSVFRAEAVRVGRARWIRVLKSTGAEG